MRGGDDLPLLEPGFLSCAVLSVVAFCGAMRVLYLFVVVAYTHRLWRRRRRDCVVGRARIVRFPITLIYLR